MAEENKRKANIDSPEDISHIQKSVKIDAEAILPKGFEVISPDMNITENFPASLNISNRLSESTITVNNEVNRMPSYSPSHRPKMVEIAEKSKTSHSACRSKKNLLATSIETKESDEENEKDNVCHVCHQFFINKNFCDAHTLLHLNESPPKCRYCGEIFPLRYNIYAHESKHLAEIGYECKICLLKFMDVSELRIHMRYHTDSELKLECDICETPFTHLRHLQSHKKLHYVPLAVDFFKCAQCPLIFYDISKLRVHCRTHCFYKPFECEICRLTFNNAFSYYCHSTKHMFTDTQYCCTKCGSALIKDGMNMNEHKCNIKG